MKKRIIYFLIALIGTVGFNSCGTQSRTGTTTGTTGNTGTTGTVVGTTTETTGTTMGTTRTGTNNQTTTTGNTTTTTRGNTTGNTSGGTTRNTTGNTSGTTTGSETQTRSATTTGNNPQATTQSGDQQTYDYQLSEDTEYNFENENYRFSPADDDRITISRARNGQETPYGDMRRMGDEGYYMINTTSSTGEEETAFGRFDDEGNFTMYRYDRDRDTVFEESFRPGASIGSGSRGNN